MPQKGNAVILSFVVALGACAEPPTAPNAESVIRTRATHQHQREGTGLVLESLTGVSLPVISEALGKIGEVEVDQAVITRLVVDEIVGGVIGLEAEGVLTLSGELIGEDVLEQKFLTQVKVVSSGPGKCEVLTVDLGPVGFDIGGELVTVDAPEAAVTARSAGAVGSLLCNLGNILQPPVNLATRAVRGLVNAINRLLL